MLSRTRSISGALQRRKCHHHYQRNLSAISPRKFTSLPRQFLEAYDDLNFDPSTHQRNDVLFDPVNGKPPIASINNTQTTNVTFDTKDVAELINKDDGCGDSSTSTSSTYSKDWIRVHEERWRNNPSDFDCQWEDIVMQNNRGTHAHEERNDAIKRVLWSNWTEDMLRDPSISPILFEYDSLRDAATRDSKSANNIFCDTQEKRVLKALYQYGLVLITGTPCQTDSLPEEFINPSLPKNANSNESAESALLHLTSLIGYHPLQTLYGPGVWSTSSKSTFYNDDADGNSASTADSAYGSTSLPLHTDMTYMASPPGVQVFLMVQPATNLPGTDSENNSESSNSSQSSPTGQSVYLDGFAAAHQLRIENPDAFDVLASTTRQYRCVDEQEGWHLEASGAAIEAVPRRTKVGGCDKWGPVKAIRHNDLDRLPDLPPFPDSEDLMSSDEFYTQLSKAHEAWDDILRRDSMRLVISLQPGDCVLVSNQRVMHGRYAFDASYYPRVVMGCYVGMDELFSKWRTNGFRVL